jgi:hypothetical protein
MMRIARGSGKSLREVNELITQYKSFEKVRSNSNVVVFQNNSFTFCCIVQVVGKMKGIKPGRGGINQLQSLVNPQILKYKFIIAFFVNH